TRPIPADAPMTSTRRPASRLSPIVTPPIDGWCRTTPDDVRLAPACAPGQHDRLMVAMASRLPRSLQVLRHRDFALVQVGNGVSQLGTGGQYVALGWAIRQLSGWPFAVSLSLVAQFLPFLLLSPVGGALADRLPRRRIVVSGSILAVPPSIALGVL